MGTHSGEYTLGVTSMENACGSHLTDLHVIVLLTLPSDWQDLHVLAFFLHLGNPYTFLKASQRPSLGGALPSSVSLTPHHLRASHTSLCGSEGSHHGTV